MLEGKGLDAGNLAKGEARGAWRWGKGQWGCLERWERAKSVALACRPSVTRGQRSPAGLVASSPISPSAQAISPSPGWREPRSALALSTGRRVCRFKSSLPARGGPSLPAPSARSRGARGSWWEQRPPGRPAGRGAGGGGRGRRGAALEERAQARGARRGGSGRGRGRRPSPGRRLCAPPAAARRRGLARRRAGWEPEGGGGPWARAANPVLPAGRAAARPPRPPLAAPSPPVRVASSPPPRAAPARARAAEPAGRVPRLRAPGRARRGPVPRPTPPPPAFPTVDERRQRSLRPPAERGAGLLGPSRPLGTQRVRKRGHPGSGLSASGAPSGARSFRLVWTERSLDRAEPGGCRARAEGIPAPSDPSYFGSRTGTPYARVTCGLRAPDPSRPGPTRRLAGVGGHFSCPGSGSAEAPPLPPPRCLPGRL